MNRDILETIVNIAIISALLTFACTSVRACSNYNTMWETNRTAIRIEALKSGRTANGINCILDTSIHSHEACERAARECAR